MKSTTVCDVRYVVWKTFTEVSEERLPPSPGSESMPRGNKRAERAVSGQQIILSIK
jgi:hypothetical protein